MAEQHALTGSVRGANHTDLMEQASREAEAYFETPSVRVQLRPEARSRTEYVQNQQMNGGVSSTPTETTFYCDYIAWEATNASNV